MAAVVQVEPPLCFPGPERSGPRHGRGSSAGVYVGPCRTRTVTHLLLKNSREDLQILSRQRQCGIEAAGCFCMSSQYAQDSTNIRPDSCHRGVSLSIDAECGEDRLGDTP